MDITTLIYCGVGIITFIVGVLFIPYLRKKYGNEKIIETINTFEYIVKEVTTAVRAMQQLHPDWDGADKRTDVLTTIRKALEAKGITFDEVVVRRVLEDAVFNMKHEALKPEVTNINTTVID